MNDKKLNDRILTLHDEKQRAIVMPDIGFFLPTSDIYDEPARCFKINVQWVKLITGWLTWLTDVAAWADATDENYIGIQKVIRILEGVECMDCNDVENCLLSSPTIAAINAAIAGNDADILTLQGDMTQAQADILQNVSDIQQNASGIQQNVSDIATNVIAIAANAVDIADNLTSIQQHDLTLADHTTRIADVEAKANNNEFVIGQNHEPRIVALESASGGGGGGTAKTIVIKELVSDTTLSVASNAINFQVDPADNYSKYEIQVWSSNATYNSFWKFKMWFNNDFVATNYDWSLNHSVQNAEAYIGDNNRSIVNFPDQWNYTEIIIENPNELKYKLSASKAHRHIDDMYNRYSHRWVNTAKITDIRLDNGVIEFAVGTYVAIYGIKEQEVLVPSTQAPFGTIDFDGGLPYTIEVNNNNAAYSASGGNPDGCAVGHVNTNDPFWTVIYDQADVGELTDFEFDLYAPDTSGKWYVTIRTGGQGSPAFYASQTGWQTLRASTLGWSAYFPPTANRIGVYIGRDASIGTDTISGIKIDNMKLYK